MKMYDFSKSILIQKQASYNGKHTFPSRMVFFFLLLLAASFLNGIAGTFYILFTSGREILQVIMGVVEGTVSDEAYMQFFEELTLKTASEPGFLLLSLFSCAFTCVAILIYALLIEKRTSASMGLASGGKGLVSSIALGLGVGTLLILCTVLFCTLTDAITVAYAPGNVLWIVGFFFAFIIQSFSEELLLRGYFMTALLRWKSNPWWAVVISALAFAFLHGGNSGVNLLGTINIFLFGILTALLTLRTGNLWCATALHAVWNFMQGNIFGISVSGTAVLPSVFETTLAVGRDFTHGGAFGLEGGCVTTILLLLALVAVMYIPPLKRETPQNT